MSDKTESNASSYPFLEGLNCPKKLLQVRSFVEVTGHKEFLKCWIYFFIKSISNIACMALILRFLSGLELHTYIACSELF